MNKTWFVTGTSSGIGRALVESLLERGERVAATLRDVRMLDDLAARYGEALWVARLDVTDAEEVRRVLDRAFDECGRIDVVVNNAGYGLFGAAEELDDDQIRRQIETNLLGSIRLIRAALPRLRAQGGGRILQVSSEGGQIAYPNLSLYHATKWGIEGFVESVAQEVASFDIGFTSVEPGPTKTRFGAALVSAPPMPAYAATASGEMRRAVETGVNGWTFSDPSKVARAMIESICEHPAPLRLTLGAGSFARVRAALEKRIAELDAQRDVALSTELDRDDVEGSAST